MATKSRNGYIDIIKFIFAIVIVLFHLGCGIFPGGRVAVEGFFMISAFLMMIKVDHDREPQLSNGVSTVKFIWKKYLGLLPFLIPSVIMAFFCYEFMSPVPIKEIIADHIPGMFFEFLTLCTAGFDGNYVLGISWYLSAMFIALAILYPLCRKYKSKFVLCVCPVMGVLFYGFLAHFVGSIAITSEYLEGGFVNCGVIRALAGSMFGCVIYEIYKRSQKVKVTKFARGVFGLIEIVGYSYFFLAMHYRPRSWHDYLIVFDLFVLLTIGICGVSFFSPLLKGNWTKPFGTISTLLVLNHFCYCTYIGTLPADKFSQSEMYLIFAGLVAGACVITYFVSKLINIIIKKLSDRKLWIQEK